MPLGTKKQENWSRETLQGRNDKAFAIWFFCQPHSDLFHDVLANGAVQVLHGYLGAGVQMAGEVLAASHGHTSTHWDAVDSGFPLGFDTTASTGAARPGVSGRHVSMYFCIFGVWPLIFLAESAEKWLRKSFYGLFP